MYWEISWGISSINSKDFEDGQQFSKMVQISNPNFSRDGQISRASTNKTKHPAPSFDELSAHGARGDTNLTSNIARSRGKQHRGYLTDSDGVPVCVLIGILIMAYSNPHITG